MKRRAVPKNHDSLATANVSTVTAVKAVNRIVMLRTVCVNCLKIENDYIFNTNAFQQHLSRSKRTHSSFGSESCYLLILDAFSGKRLCVGLLSVRLSVPYFSYH